MNKKISFPIALTIIIVLAVLLVGGVFAYQYYLMPKGELPKIVSNTLPAVKNNDETADWKTYKNDKYGFEIKYPQDWHEITDSFPKSKALFTFCPSTNNLCAGHDDLFIYFNVYDARNFESLLSFNSFVRAGTQENEKNIFIENNPAIKTEGTRCSDNLLKDYSVVTKRGDYFYEIHTYSDCNKDKITQLNNIFNQMLSTFKFTR